MYRILLLATRVCLIVFLLGGVAVVVGQTVGIVVGSGPLVESFGDTVTEIACVVAAVTGALAFLLLYTQEGRQYVDE
ncbi:hypothetical protein GCM10011609_29190 [Lentzea pudingi]|uniref:Uncharacterized protein n=1 Tax=Lentzea pudingi TaxID=1789439 RepID=A0ABQ2HSK4_9PSEU|nr:hypothetical protein [Lentzea pudingi]GGM90377.1 hypothetical protein GCM10011609_29190 [Lentzea pudingi]